MQDEPPDPGEARASRARSAATASWSRRRARSGRPFYGCARYPACDWVSFARPLAEPCEVCGGLRIPLGQDKVHCIGCDGELPTRTRKSRGRPRQAEPAVGAQPAAGAPPRRPTGSKAGTTARARTNGTRRAAATPRRPHRSGTAKRTTARRQRQGNRRAKAVQERHGRHGRSNRESQPRPSHVLQRRERPPRRLPPPRLPPARGPPRRLTRPHGPASLAREPER